MSLASDVMVQVKAFQRLLRLPQLRSLDARELLTQASRFARVEADFVGSLGAGYKPLKLSVLASLSAQHLCASLRLFLYAEGLAPLIHLGGYDAVATGILQPDAEVWDVAPDALLLLPVTEDIKTWPRMFATNTEVDEWVERQANIYLAIWDAVASKLPECRIYQTLFVHPLERPLGDLERHYPFSRSRSLRALNDYLVEHRPRHVSLIDMDALAGLAGRRHWFDETGYFLSKQSVSLRELPLVSAYLARRIASGCGKVKKCLVLDLDNTLWGGVVGDDGNEGIRIDRSDSVGEAFVHFQRYLVALRERGVLLAVCSKNDSAIARDAFTANPEMPLKLSDFAAFVANWDDKLSNIRRISKELNIGIDSLVFFDDNPAERAIVQEFEPGVFTIDVPADPALYVRALDLSFAFEWERLTDEDLVRSDTYKMNHERKELEAQFTDYDAYLRSLQMKAWIEPVTRDGIARLAQLFGKTNQFNTRGERYSEGAIAQLAAAADSNVLQVKFADRFSHYGIVAGVVLRQRGEAVVIDNWIMSCRVFERGLEKATLKAIVAYSLAHGLNKIIGEFVPSPKNVYVEGLFPRLGFSAMPGEDGVPSKNGGKIHVLDISTPPQIDHHIDAMIGQGGGMPTTNELPEMDGKGSYL
jgi:FkbH-like protein